MTITDIKDILVCEDFDDDCRDVEDPEDCAIGGWVEWNSCHTVQVKPCVGLCAELQRRYAEQQPP